MVFGAERDNHLQHFIDNNGWQGSLRQKISGDASFRQYERLRHAKNPPAILMNAPPPKERIDHFLAIVKILDEMGVSVPRIYAADVNHGFIMMEDFGDNTYTRLLQGGHSENDLYQLAVDLLIHIRRQSSDKILAALPNFDDQKIINQVQVFLDWYWPAIYQQPVSSDIRQDFVGLWQKLLNRFKQGPQALTHFDFHVDNLMLLPGRPGIQACGVLDFQDAVCGPAIFDCMSLLDDARRDVAKPLATTLKQCYLAAFPRDEHEQLAQSYAFWGAQRHTRILGTFARLHRRDGKPGYLHFIPRVWRQLQTAISYPDLRSLQQWFATYFPNSNQVI